MEMWSQWLDRKFFNSIFISEICALRSQIHELNSKSLRKRCVDWYGLALVVSWQLYPLILRYQQRYRFYLFIIKKSSHVLSAGVRKKKVICNILKDFGDLSRVLTYLLRTISIFTTVTGRFNAHPCRFATL